MDRMSISSGLPWMASSPERHVLDARTKEIPKAVKKTERELRKLRRICELLALQDARFEHVAHGHTSGEALIVGNDHQRETQFALELPE